jgi:hypothetical protein
MPNLMAVFSPHTVGLEGLCLHYGVDGTTMCRGADLCDTRKNDIECDAIQGMSVQCCAHREHRSLVVSAQRGRMGTPRQRGLFGI